MSHPLSIITFFNRNQKRIFPVIIIIALSGLCLISVSAIVQSLNSESLKYVNFYKEYSTIEIDEFQTENFTKEDLEEEISTWDEIDRVLTDVERLETTVQSPIGLTPKFIYFLRSNDYQDFTEQLGWNIVEGTWPTPGTNEIALSASIIKNKNLNIGDSLGSFVDEQELLPGNFKLVGKISDEATSGGIGSLEFFQANNLDNEARSWYLLHPRVGYEERLTNRLNMLDEREPGIKIWTEETYMEFLDNQFILLNQIIFAMMAIILTITTFSVATLQFIFYGQRIGEFSILSVIGYSKRYILLKTAGESVLITTIAWGMCILLTWSLFIGLNSYLLEPRGMQLLSLLSNNIWLYSLPAPITVFIFSYLIQSYNLAKLDTISIIEKRD